MCQWWAHDKKLFFMCQWWAYTVNAIKYTNKFCICKKIEEKLLKNRFESPVFRKFLIAFSLYAKSIGTSTLLFSYMQNSQELLHFFFAICTTTRNFHINFFHMYNHKATRQKNGSIGIKNSYGPITLTCCGHNLQAYKSKFTLQILQPDRSLSLFLESR